MNKNGPVLLVIENPTDLWRLSGDLKEGGFEALLVRSGERALGIFGLNKPPLVIVDQNVDGISGFDLAKRLIASFPDAAVRIIIAAQGAEEKMRQLAQDAGAVDWLPKPIDGDKLLQLVRQHMPQPA